MSAQRKTTLVVVAVAATIFTSGAFAAESSVAATSTPTATTPKPLTLNFNDKCKNGGTRVSTGSYDPTAGTITLAETMTACIDADNTQHDGTVMLNGTLVAGSAANTYNLNITYNFNTTYTNTTGSVQRVCTWQKNGVFDTTKSNFTGTLVKTNCTLTINETEKGNIVEHILKKAHQIEGS